MRSLFIQCLLGAALLCAVSAAAQAAAPSAPAPASDEATNRFDGDWTLRIACPAAANARPYAVEMPASILNGQLFASNGAQGLPGAMQVDGTVQPDGQLQLQARGRPDDPARDTAYAVAAPVRFDAGARHASGQLPGRDCRLDLSPR